jgi:peptidoglycan/LPS O-acetylase OafA/YrhL
MNYIAAFAVAIGSYYLLEKPCIRLGHRIAHPPTEGREDLILVGQGT